MPCHHPFFFVTTRVWKTSPFARSAMTRARWYAPVTLSALRALTLDGFQMSRCTRWNNAIPVTSQIYPRSCRTFCVHLGCFGLLCLTPFQPFPTPRMQNHAHTSRYPSSSVTHAATPCADGTGPSGASSPETSPISVSPMLLRLFPTNYKRSDTRCRLIRSNTSSSKYLCWPVSRSPLSIAPSSNSVLRRLLPSASTERGRHLVHWELHLRPAG